MRRNRAGALRCLVLAVAALALTACPEVVVPIVTAPRTISIDVRNALFDSPDPSNPATQGLGATSLTLAVTTDPATGGGDATIGTTDLDLTAEANGYTRVSIDVEGTLVSVDATADTPAGVFTQTLIDYPGEDVYQGWVAFANVLKFRLGYAVATPVEESSLSLSVAPRGGADVTVRADSGVAGTDQNPGFTDRSADLNSGEVAVRVDLDENPTDVTFDVYTAVVEQDIATLYDPAVNFEGTYATDPWSPAWTYAQIAGEGRSVGGTVYTLTRYREAPFNAADPHADGKRALFLDLTTGGDPDFLDKYLLVGIIVTAEGLSLPVDVLCLDIE